MATGPRYFKGLLDFLLVPVEPVGLLLSFPALVMLGVKGGGIRERSYSTVYFVYYF